RCSCERSAGPCAAESRRFWPIVRSKGSRPGPKIRGSVAEVYGPLGRESLAATASPALPRNEGVLMGITDRATGEAATGAIDVEFRHELAQQLRVDSVRASAAAGSGHPTSSMSAADLMAVLLDGYLKLDYSRPDDPHRDHLIFSKGHASPLYYSILKAVGSIDDGELLTFRKLGSRLEGHPTPRIPPTDVATGSLGQGFPIGVG